MSNRVRERSNRLIKINTNSKVSNRLRKIINRLIESTTKFMINNRLKIVYILIKKIVKREM